MEYYDQHVHSIVSMDCEVPMSAMALAAADAGARWVTFTDHCDLEHYVTGIPDPDCYDEALRQREYQAALAAVGDRMELLLGIELGGVNHQPERAREFSQKELDLIIASVHNLRGMPDFYTLCNTGKLADREYCKTLLERYALEHLELAEQGGFDVVGHIGYPLRYMIKQGHDLSLAPYRDIFAKAFRLMAEKGLALELNTSAARYNMGWTPEPWLLSLYRQMGGELITLGSDAHEPRHIADGFSTARDMLLSLGFTRLTLFRGRQAEFIQL